MSAPPSFHSAGREDLKFWEGNDGHTVIVCESLSKSEQELWSKNMRKSKDWVVWCRSRNKNEDQRPFEADGKEKWIRKEAKGKSMCWKAWWQRRRLGMVVAGNMPTARFLSKTGKMQSAGCRLCKTALEARGESTDGLAAETKGYINSAGCEGMATTVTAAHHSIWRHLYDSMHAAQKPKSKLKFVTTKKVT